MKHVGRNARQDQRWQRGKKRMTNGRAANKIFSCCLHCRLEDKREDYQNCSVAPVLCTTVVHNDTYTCEQFLKLSVGFRAIVCKTASPYAIVPLTVCDVGVLWPNGWMDHDETWHVSRPWPRHIVLDGDPAPPKRGTAPIFGPCLLWPNGWMDQDPTWCGGRPRSRRHRVTWCPALPQKGTVPNFRHMSIVAKRSPISAGA